LIAAQIDGVTSARAANGEMAFGDFAFNLVHAVVN
jgi:hypothetical protein